MVFGLLREIAGLVVVLAGVKSIERGSGELKPFCVVARVGVVVVFSESMASEKSESESEGLSDSIGSSRSRPWSRSGSGGSFKVVLVVLLIVAMRVWQCNKCGGKVGVVVWLVQLVWLGSEF